MRYRGARWFMGLLLGGGCLVASAGCGTSPASRFYALSPIESPGGVTITAGQPIALVIRSVQVPMEVDRPQIVTRTGENTLQLAEFDRWASPLRDSISQLIADNLSVLLQTDRVAVYPSRLDVSVDGEVRVQITRFEGRLGGVCALDAQWHVVSNNGRATVYGRSRLSEMADSSYTSVVATQSRLVGLLSSEIAAAIQAGSR
jgi:uncharacterized lipoprotein YmbA